MSKSLPIHTLSSDAIEAADRLVPTWPRSVGVRPMLSESALSDEGLERKYAMLEGISRGEGPNRKTD